MKGTRVHIRKTRASDYSLRLYNNSTTPSQELIANSSNIYTSGKWHLGSFNLINAVCVLDIVSILIHFHVLNAMPAKTVREIAWKLGVTEQPLWWLLEASQALGIVRYTPASNQLDRVSAWTLTSVGRELQSLRYYGVAITNKSEWTTGWQRRLCIMLYRHDFDLIPVAFVKDRVWSKRKPAYISSIQRIYRNELSRFLHHHVVKFASTTATGCVAGESLWSKWVRDVMGYKSAQHAMKSCSIVLVPYLGEKENVQLLLKRLFLAYPSGTNVIVFGIFSESCLPHTYDAIICMLRLLSVVVEINSLKVLCIQNVLQIFPKDTYLEPLALSPSSLVPKSAFSAVASTIR